MTVPQAQGAGCRPDTGGSGFVSSRLHPVLGEGQLKGREISLTPAQADRLEDPANRALMAAEQALHAHAEGE